MMIPTWAIVLAFIFMAAQQCLIAHQQWTIRVAFRMYWRAQYGEAEKCPL